MTKPPRILSATDRAARWRVAGLVAALLGALALVDPNRPLPFDVCLLKRLTGLSCAGCGMTRSICHALHGDFAGSLALHPAGLLVLAALVGWGLSSAIEAWRGTAFRRRRALARRWLSGGLKPAGYDLPQPGMRNPPIFVE